MCYNINMNFINDNANIFFFVTTIFVTVLIIIALFVLYLILKVKNFIQKLIEEGETIIENNKDNKFINAGLPVLLPILAFFFKNKKKTNARK